MTSLPPSLSRLLTDLGQPIACLDLETTGGNPQRDAILELGIVTLSMERGQEEWSQLLHPGCGLSPYITQLTGIYPDMLRGKPRFEDIVTELEQRLRGHIIIAHNARFDLAFLRQSFLRTQVPFKTKSLCSVKLSRQLFPSERRHGLDAIIERLAIPCADRHRALGDARVVVDFLRQMAEQRYDDLLHACRIQWDQNCLPPNIDPDVLEQLPNRPGVYLFYGHSDLPLYIGKSIHLRRRVLEHFRNDFRQTRELQMSQQLERIEWIETNSELSALLLESRLVKEKHPLYNRQLRRKKELCTIFWLGPEQEKPTILCGSEPRPGVCYGVFANRHQARAALRHLAQEWGLCDHRLGLQKGSGACFGQQIKRCQGVCVGQESLASHDLRLQEALQKLQIQHWPFSGPIGFIEEKDGSCIHVFEQWRHIGMLDARTKEKTALKDMPAFDLDTYRILLRYIGKSETQILELDDDWHPLERQSADYAVQPD